jgi:hypothetical protein
VLNHLTPFNPNDIFIVYSPDARSRLKLPYQQKPIRSVDAWNALPPTLRSSSSLSAFKRSLEQFDLLPCIKGSAL